MKAIIMGCGRVGEQVGKILDSEGHEVTMIDYDAEALERIGPGFRGRKIIGVGFDRNVLISAGIETAKGPSPMWDAGEEEPMLLEMIEEPEEPLALELMEDQPLSLDILDDFDILPYEPEEKIAPPIKTSKPAPPKPPSKPQKNKPGR